jgi:hypothetical protein
MCRSGIDRLSRLIAAALAGIALGLSLGGCSDLYFDRREPITLGAGDAIAANEAEQMVDPWPAQSGNRNIGFNGAKMQSAVERYRTNKVIPPVNATTSAFEAPIEQGAAQPAGTQTAASNTSAVAGQ